MAPLKSYYRLAKPGIIYGNAITGLAGFLLGSNGNIHLLLLLETVVGLSLVIGSACVVNNYLDRGIDSKMERTKKRALASGQIKTLPALIYAAALGIAGVLILALWVNRLTVLVGGLAFIDYVVLYGLAKRRSVHGTVVGSFSGAAPVVMGYVAAVGQLNREALLLFLILVFWQMPHFYAIAIYRLKDYKAAKLPMLPIKKGIAATKMQMWLYIMAFVAATALLTILGYTGYTYLVVTALLGLGWLRLSLKGLRASDNLLWAHQLFKFSLIVLLGFSLMISLNAWLP